MRRLMAALVLTFVGCGTDSGVENTTAMKSQSAEPKIVEFHIALGTAKSPWNTPETIIEVNLGDTLRIVNDDTINHRLHTNGKPCPHGPDMAPGASFDCKITKAFDPSKDGPLYDHHVGSKASFWVKASN